MVYARFIATVMATAWLLSLAAGPLPALARIKLVALPERGATIIHLDNPQATLIEEERVLTLQKGINRVDFSWNGVSIDADSIRLQVLDHPDQVTLLNVSYPRNEAALVWEIASREAVEEQVRVSYLLSNIDRLITYTAVADKDETALAVKSHLILRNFSGEDFPRTQVLLDYGQAFETGIGHEETKQLALFRQTGVPLVKVWRFDAARDIWDPEQVEHNVGIPVSYRMTNDEAAGFGQYSLWGGKVRVYQEDGHGSTIFLGEDRTKSVPVGEKMEIAIGDSRDIVVTQRKMKEQRINIRRNKHNQVVLYDTDEVIRAKIENFKSTPAVLTMVQHIAGQWDMEQCSHEYTRKDASTLEFEIELAPQGKQELIMHYHRRNLRD